MNLYKDKRHILSGWFAPQLVLESSSLAKIDLLDQE
jgi:hypothetical protein